MPEYRKKPVVIEARRITRESYVDIAAWCSGQPVEEDGDVFIAIRTLEGVMTGDVGDFIIKGVLGEFYPCKPDIFEQTYDMV